MVGDEQPRCVLVVDDDQESCLLLAELVRLSVPGTVVLTAGDGAEGVRLAQLVRPSAVVLDLEMPVLDGIGAATAIRQALGAASIILALSGSPQQLEHAATRGLFDACFLKPIALATLLGALGLSGGATTPPARSARGAREP